MAEKSWMVSHPKARNPILVTGKTLPEALEKENLNPAIWKPIGQPTDIKEQPNGDNQGDGRPEDN